jgi:MFS family permease
LQALAPIGALVGAPLSGVMSDRWGRKEALVWCGIPYLIGYLFLTYAHYMPTALGFQALALTGRFLTGVGMGWAGSCGPVYIGEISSPKLRGLFGAFTQIAIATGIVLNYGISSFPKITYFYSALIAVGIITVFECLVVWLKESPSWLICHGQRQKAVQVLQWLRGPSVKVEQEVERIQEANSMSLWLAMKEMSTKRHIAIPILLVMLSMFFHQIGGAHVLSTYAALLFENAGVAKPELTALGAVGGVELVATFLTILVIDFVGRKVLLVLSSIGMVAGSAMLGAHYYITRPSTCDPVGSDNSTGDFLIQARSGDMFQNCINAQFTPLAISSAVLFAVAYSIGWGPVPWVLLSELIPVRVRGAASGIATLVNWGSAALVIGVYLEYSEAVRDWFAWWTFAFLNTIAAVFAIVFIRETKGKTLEDIEIYYQEHWC